MKLYPRGFHIPPEETNNKYIWPSKSCDEKWHGGRAFMDRVVTSVNEGEVQGDLANHCT